MLRVSEDGRRRSKSYVESYRQLGGSLLELQHAADRIFDTISKRTAEERDKLTEISQRIRIAKARIDTISRSKQALIISSPSRYPASSVSEDFRPLFPYKEEQTDARFPVTKLLVNGGLNREFERDGTLELYQFFSEEITGHPSKETYSKVGATPTHPKENTFLEDLFGKEEFSDSSFLTVDHTSDIMLDSKNQGLPPPPPSLLLNDYPPLRKPKVFKSTLTIKPVHDMKPLDAVADAINQKPDAHSDLRTASDSAISDDQ